MSILLFANEAQTTLAYPASSTSTLIVVAAGTAQFFPNPGTGEAFKLTLISATNTAIKEVVLVTAVSGNEMTVIRGQEGTIPRAWKAGDYVANLMTAGTGDAFVQFEQLTLGNLSPVFNGLTVNGTATINDLTVTGVMDVTANRVLNNGQVTTNATFFVPFISGNENQGYPTNSNNELNFNPSTGKLESPLLNAPAGMGGGIF